MLDFLYFYLHIFTNMNKETINYAFLAGFLESSLKSIADDYAFLEMKNYSERRAHLDKIIARANQLAKENSYKVACF
jgi:hypothetical protein